MAGLGGDRKCGGNDCEEARDRHAYHDGADAIISKPGGDMRERLCLWMVVLLVFLRAAAALAQQTSNLTGVVTDAQNAVLPGVTVTASSPALIGTQTVISEANG